MASLVYRCRLNPQGCPTQQVPGYCDHHPWIELVAAEPSTNTRSQPNTDASPHPTPSGQDSDTAGPSPDPARRHPGTETAPQRPLWGVSIPGLDVTVPIPADGLEVGRDCPRFATVPGMQHLDQVSRTHARLTWKDTTLYLEDLGSTNGTFVDEHPIHTAVAVTPHNRLRLAEDVDIRVVELDEELEEL
ncbi:FHA domain-containing protein [Lipingzhangella sp. LS1_29]|uniref:FHA domain-containing protein n=1 Tax=Lipingzhangella rawalii TaxID=2055835 RepID=A0ABU2H3D4_9ACTN|nr:FHA domain-containing protein [Lipingzhangella rawalii]MDS1269134.1 FHA domain-containing protein [Lipingzhangella rawalii]